MADKIQIIEAQTPQKLYEAIGKRNILSLEEVWELRTQTALDALQAAGILLKHLGPNFEDAVILARAIKDIPIWGERITTSTHMMKGKDGHGFVESQYHPVGENINDGGSPYPAELLDQCGQRWICDKEYRQHPGGTYLVDHWLRHPVLKLAVNSADVIANYGEIIHVLSHHKVTSPGRESIWCPQELPEGHGRAWASGSGGEAAYPPNLTTKNHWAAVKE